MTRFLPFLLAFLCAGFLFAPTAQAQHKLRTVRGEIVAVDAHAGTFDLKTHAGPTVTIVVRAKTRVQVDGKPGSIADLQVGMHARAAGRAAPKHKALIARYVQAKSAP